MCAARVETTVISYLQPAEIARQRSAPVCTQDTIRGWRSRAHVEKHLISMVRWAQGGIHDKLGAESRPVIAAALWTRTAPAQIGGLGECEYGGRWTNPRAADKKAPN